MKRTAFLLIVLALCLVARAANTNHQAIQIQSPDRQHTDERAHSRIHPPKTMNDSDFGILYDKVKRKPFTSDKMELVEVGALGAGFTCAQCQRIMSLFTFDNEKQEVLRFMAPRLTDPGNADAIISGFTFDKDRKEAAKTIFDAMKNHPQGR